MENVIALEKTSLRDIETVGGKNASLGEMIQHLSMAGIRVPNGFATTTDAYKRFLTQNGLDKKIYQLLSSLSKNDAKALKKASTTIRRLILNTPFPDDFNSDVVKAYAKISDKKNMTVAVRSSANAEDLPDASFAGQNDTYLNISGIKQVLQAIKNVYASLFSERSISYRNHNKIKHSKVGISAGIQKMVRSDKATSGVIFTLDTETGFNKVILISASYGLGEAIVQGVVDTDEFYVYKPALEQKKPAILRRNLGKKLVKIIYDNSRKSTLQTKIIKVPQSDQIKFCISDHEITELAQFAMIIEKHYQKPMDIEWAKDGTDGKLYIVQARPETVQSRNNQTIERFSLLEKGNIKISGRSIGQRIGQGLAHVVMDPKKMCDISKGEILVTDMTDPDWEPIMKLASGIITNRGGRTCHAAIIARELGIPAIVGSNNATSVIKNREPITVSCSEGEVGYAYSGLLKYKVDKMSVKDLPSLPVKIYMNLGNPDKAFMHQSLPCDGVGLARLEFIISNMIGIHPNAALQFKSLPKKLRNKISEKAAAYSSPVEFYIEKLREGISIIAAAFYPKQVIFRFSDFKTNEYANLLGGEFFEPHEENPMLGFRGASRYIDEKFRGCFELECKAFKRVRNDLGLINAQVMVPFVRTIGEIKETVALMEKFGLKRGVNNLKIYMMCEIPSNVVLADEFLKHVDGFSIGSNDLTQLTLGLDRDSELVASLFDERNDAVKSLLQQAITACNNAGKYVGICGQAPSDYPELAKWLIKQGIQSISLSPDSVIETRMLLAEVKEFI